MVVLVNLSYNWIMRILDKPVTKSDMIKESENFIDEHVIKGVVDVKRELMAIDSPMHYDCEQFLIENGSKQHDLWGINLYLDEDNVDDLVEFDSMINIRPAQGNRTRFVEDAETQARIKAVVKKWLI